MKHTKRLLSLLLSVMMCLFIIPALQANATSKTADEAIAWVKSKLGQGLDMDGAYGCQCVDLIFAYYDFLGVARSSGNGADYAWNALPSGWQRLQGVQPKKGDILVYSGSGSNPYGHVGIYESDYAHYHQNVDGKSYVTKITSYKYNGFYTNSYWGVIRPNWSNHDCSFNASATVIKAPTRTATGTRLCYCACGKAQTQTIPAIPYTTSLADGIYTIMTKLKTGSYFACDGESNAYIWDGNGADLFWLFIKNSDGTYSIRNAYYSGKYLTIANSSMVYGGNLGVSAYTGNDNQKFYVIPEGSSYRMVAKNSYMTIDLQGGHTANGTNVQQFYDNGTDSQRWAIDLKSPKINLSKSSVSVAAGSSATIQCSMERATNGVSFKCSNYDSAVCSTSWGNWAYGALPLTITAKSGGTTSITVTLYDLFTGIVLDTKTIAVTIPDTGKPTASIESTNNVADSQTVTLSMKDNAGLAGYHWGTSSSYSSNTFTFLVLLNEKSHTVAKTVSSAGTYYLTAKDASGNVSATVSKTFYETTLNANGGSVSPADVLTMSGNSFTLPTPTRTGYTFKNWNTSSDGNSTAYTGTYKPTANTTLYAVWEKNAVTLYTLNYNANGGTDAPVQQTGNGTVTLSTGVPTRDGYAFLGWAASGSASKAQHAPGAPFTLTANATLYAVWQKNETPDEPHLEPMIAIRNYAEIRTVDYRTSIVFSVDKVENPVPGAQVHWFIDGQDKGATDTCIVRNAEKSFTVQAKYMKDGKTLAESKTETVNVKTDFLARLKSFFRSLFGILPVIAQEYLGAEVVDRIPS